VVGADLECLITTHDQSGLAVFLVLKQANIASATLLPLASLADELEQLGAHLEHLLLRLLVGLGLDLLRKFDDGLEVHVLGLGGFLLLAKELAVSIQYRFMKMQRDRVNPFTSGRVQRESERV
jgi:hypothetical protein